MRSYRKSAPPARKIIPVIVSFTVNYLVERRIPAAEARDILAHCFTGYELEQALKLHETLVLIFGGEK